MLGTVVLVMTAPGIAQARPLEQDHFRESTSEVVQNFCGLTVRIDTEVRGTFLVNAHGPDGLAHFSERLHSTESFTNLANDSTFTAISNVLSKDLKVTDNGDGTLTILVLATGSFKVYVNGEFVLSDPGQVRFEILVDHAGTPADPTDDTFLEFLGLVKGSTGRNDLEGRDFCTDIQEFIG